MPEQNPAAVAPEALEAEVVSPRARVAVQEAWIAQLLERIQELEARLANNSHNCTKPPSSDSLPSNNPPPRSLRQSMGRKPGGQKGHPGATSELVADPEHTVTLPLTGHCAFG